MLYRRSHSDFATPLPFETAEMTHDFLRRKGWEQEPLNDFSHGATNFITGQFSSLIFNTDHSHYTCTRLDSISLASSNHRYYYSYMTFYECLFKYFSSAFNRISIKKFIIMQNENTRYKFFIGICISMRIRAKTDVLWAAVQKIIIISKKKFNELSYPFRYFDAGILFLYTRTHFVVFYLNWNCCRRYSFGWYSYWYLEGIPIQYKIRSVQKFQARPDPLKTPVRFEIDRHILLLLLQ